VQNIDYCMPLCLQLKFFGIFIFFLNSFDTLSQPCNPGLKSFGSFAGYFKYLQFFIKRQRITSGFFRSKSIYEIKSILLIRSAADSWNISGYLAGLSAPSGVLSSITLIFSPILNSAGQTRLPTFSTMRRSILFKSKEGRASRIILPSIWQAPPVLI